MSCKFKNNCTYYTEVNEKTDTAQLAEKAKDALIIGCPYRYVADIKVDDAYGYRDVETRIYCKGKENEYVLMKCVPSSKCFDRYFNLKLILKD